MTQESRRERQRRELHDSILDEARTLLSEGGPAAVSLRAISRALGMSAPSLYTYVSSLGDLFTKLIVQSYQSLAAEIEGAVDAASHATLEDRLAAGPSAYRSWALAHRQQFNLVFFDQIADYEAPPDGPTVKAQTAVLMPIATEYAKARGTSLEQLIEPGDMLDDFLGWWGTFHGLVALEVNHHLDWVDSERVFQRRLERDIQELLLANS